MSKTNCYRFTTNPGGSDGRMQLIVGFEAEKTYRRGQASYLVRMRSGHIDLEVPVDQGIVVKKTDGRYRIYRADISTTEYSDNIQQADVELVSCRTDCARTLILVYSYYDVVCNSRVSRPHFDQVVTWIGADGPGLIRQAGSHRSPLKKQLFRLEQGESILFFDAKKEVTKITAGKFGERPRLERATSIEVAKYALSEAEKRGDNPSTRAWCFYALQELGCQRQLDEFCRLFPSFLSHHNRGRL